jgi:hypothetical protein
MEKYDREDILILITIIKNSLKSNDNAYSEPFPEAHRSSSLDLIPLYRKKRKGGKKKKEKKKSKSYIQ